MDFIVICTFLQRNRLVSLENTIYTNEITLAHSSSLLAASFSNSSSLNSTTVLRSIGYGLDEMHWDTIKTATEAASCSVRMGTGADGSTTFSRIEETPRFSLLDVKGDFAALTPSKDVHIPLAPPIHYISVKKNTSIVVGINTLRITDAITQMRKSPRTIVTIPKIPIAMEISIFFFPQFRGKNQLWSMFSLSTHLSTWTRRRRWEARCCPWRKRSYSLSRMLTC